eukprot:UN33122
MTDYNKWNKFCFELSDSEGDNVDYQAQANSVKKYKDEIKHDPFSDYPKITDDQKSKIKNLFSEFDKGSTYQSPESEKNVEKFLNERKTFIDTSKGVCKKLIDDIIKSGVNPTDLCSLILDNDSIRFW